jgi:hypothetical protein
MRGVPCPLVLQRQLLQLRQSLHPNLGPGLPLEATASKRKHRVLLDDSCSFVISCAMPAPNGTGADTNRRVVAERLQATVTNSRK